ncbi:MAG: CbtB-domain containing protein [Nitrospiraceae bacterium]|nr:CbtB-domain containing protein [Nitrospiraceae bacterium]
MAWWQVIAVLGFFLWIPVTLYLLLFAPLPMVHDMVHPVRHAFSFVMCHYKSFKN